MDKNWIRPRPKYILALLQYFFLHVLPKGHMQLSILCFIGFLERKEKKLDKLNNYGNKTRNKLCGTR
jgi:hypothetical protein